MPTAPYCVLFTFTFCAITEHLESKHQLLCYTDCPAVTSAYLALALLVALGEKPMRFRGLLPKLSSLAGYLLPPLKNLRHGDEESEPMVGLSSCPSLLPLPLGVIMPDDDGGDGASISRSSAPLRGLVAIGFKLGLMEGSEPAMMSCLLLLGQPTAELLAAGLTGLQGQAYSITD